MVATLLIAVILSQHLYFRWRLRLKERELVRQKELTKFGEQRLADSAEAWRLFSLEEKIDAN